MSSAIPPRKWQISADGFPIGPHGEADIIGALARGELADGHCRPIGELKWQRLDDVPQFAEVLRRRAETGVFPAVPKQ